MGDWALKWTEGSEVIQVLFVMLVFPVIMNATQYYIIDSFIKNQTPGDIVPQRLEGEDVAEHHQPIGRYDDPEHNGEEEELFSEDEDEEVKGKNSGEGDSRESLKGKDNSTRGKNIGSGSMRTKRATGLVTHGEYDPIFDGESSPTVVGSASGSSRGLGLANKEVASDDEESKRPGSSR